MTEFFSQVIASLPYLWKGMFITLLITVTAVAVGMVFGAILALCRLSHIGLLSWAASAYVGLFRSVPLVMVLLWFYLIVPQALSAIFGSTADLRLASAMIGFSLFESAYYCEIIRAGIQNVSKGQQMAGLALGLSPMSTMRWIVLPQAFSNMAPLLLTQAIILFQDTSLVYVIGLADFFGAAYKVGTRDGQLVQMLLFAGLIYFVLSLLASRMVSVLKRKWA